MQYSMEFIFSFYSFFLWNKHYLFYIWQGKHEITWNLLIIKYFLYSCRYKKIFLWILYTIMNVHIWCDQWATNECKINLLENTINCESIRIFWTRYGYPIIHHPDKVPAFCRKNRCLYYWSICRIIRFYKRQQLNLLMCKHFQLTR